MNWQAVIGQVLPGGKRQQNSNVFAINLNYIHFKAEKLLFTSSLYPSYCSVCLVMLFLLGLQRDSMMSGALQ